MICLAAQKRRSLNDSLVVSEAEIRFLQTDLSVTQSTTFTSRLCRYLNRRRYRQELFLVLASAIAGLLLTGQV